MIVNITYCHAPDYFRNLSFVVISYWTNSKQEAMTTYATTQPLPASYIVQSPGIVTANEEPHRATKNKSTFLGIGIAEVSIGALCVCLGIAVYIVIPFPFSYVGAGLWGGIWYIISGSLGIASGVNPNDCNVVAGLVISILASLAAFGAAIADALAATFWAALTNGTSTLVGIHGALAFLSFVEFILAIVHSAYCCSAGCGNRTHQGRVIASTTVMTVPVGNAGYQPQPQVQTYANWNAQPQQMQQPAPVYTQPDKFANA
ncbi:uncharacterized protein LOC120336488 [Styela clava]